MKRYLAAPALMSAAFVCAACASSVPSSTLPLPVPAPTTTETVTGSVRPVTSWKITPVAQSRAYSSVLTTVITQTDVIAQRRDSLTTQASYSITPNRLADSLSFTGSVSSFIVKGSTADVSEVQPIFPVSFSGKLSNHSLSIQGSGSHSTSVNCTDLSEASLRIILRNVFVLPLELTDQQTWSDSTSSSVCYGAMPLSITSIRVFRVVGESVLDGFPVLIVDENERTFSKGEGSQDQHRIFVEAQGTTTGRFYLDPASGQLIATNLVNKTSLSIQSSGRTQHFLQNSTEVTRRMP